MLRSYATESDDTVSSVTRDKHLFQRRNSQNWQLRLMVPLAARPVVGCSEFTKSLGVADKRRAIDLSHAILAKWKAEIHAAMLSSPVPVIPGPQALEAVAFEIGFQRASERAADLIRDRARSGASYESLRAKIDQRLSDAIRQRQAGDYGLWVDRARKIIADSEWSLDEHSPAFATFVENLATGGIDTLAYAKAVFEGRDGHFTPSLFVQQEKDRKASTAAKGETILALFERYSAQRLAEGRQRQDTIDQGRKVIKLFAHYVGSNRALSSIKPVEVREWRNAVASLPPAFQKRIEYRGLCLKEASDQAVKLGLTGLSPNTVNRYLSTVSPLFDWARQEGYVDTNPCDGLFYDLQKLKRSNKARRPPFSVNDLNTIFASPLFVGFEKDGKEWNSGKCQTKDWRYWIPLLCLFTGARIGEIAQLRAEDVCEDGGIDYLYIRNDESTGQTTKSGYSRSTAIHSTLIKIGFLAFAKQRKVSAKQDGNSRLFPELKPNVRGQISWTPSRFWRTYLMRIGVKSGRDGFGSHSFRHGLADQLRLAGYLDDEIEVALGHNQVSVTAGYGQIRQGTVKRISDMIEKVQFEGVSFDHLIPKASLFSKA